MQNRMINHPLQVSQINQLLKDSFVATLATINEDGTPYITPIHFVFLHGNIYFHGLPAGQKLDNLKRNPNVSFNVYRMDEILLDVSGKPCDTNTKYESVIIRGETHFIKNQEKKMEILNAIIAKYTPQLVGNTLPTNMVNGTAVIEITPQKTTGKYYGF